MAPIIQNPADFATEYLGIKPELMDNPKNVSGKYIGTVLTESEYATPDGRKIYAERHLVHVGDYKVAVIDASDKFGRVPKIGMSVSVCGGARVNQLCTRTRSASCDLGM